MSRIPLRLSLLAGAGLTGLVLAGCSSSTPAPQEPANPVTSASPAALIVQAADATKSAGSAKVSSTTDITGSGINTTVKASGVVDFENQQVDLDVQADMLGQSQTLQVIMTGGHTYVQVPMLGDKWIEAPMQDLGMSMASPEQSLDQLRSMANLQEAGTETVAGVTTTKYTGTVDLQEALAQSGLSAEQLQQLQGELGKAGARTADVTVWVDGENHIVKADQTMTLTPSASGGLGSMGPMTVRSSTTFSDFGAKVSITPPPAGQIMDLNQLKKSGLAGMPTPSAG